MQTQITMLNNMASSNFTEALDRHVEWGIEVLDLKAGIFDKKLIDLTIDEAKKATSEISHRELKTYCFSSLLFSGALEDGKDAFRQKNLDPLDHLLEIASILQPSVIRLLVPETEKRPQLDNAVSYVQENHGWIFDLYLEAIELVNKAGFETTIESELGGCIFSTPEEVRDFFSILNTQKVSFTWDAQNLWQMGTFPSIEVYEKLKPLIGYVHLKGGKTEGDKRELVWAAPLEEASWPVEEIVRKIVKDGVSPVLCLNGSHGRKPPGYDFRLVAQRDLKYITRIVAEV